MINREVCNNSKKSATVSQISKLNQVHAHAHCVHAHYAHAFKVYDVGLLFWICVDRLNIRCWRSKKESGRKYMLMKSHKRACLGRFVKESIRRGERKQNCWNLFIQSITNHWDSLSTPREKDIGNSSFFKPFKLPLLLQGWLIKIKDLFNESKPARKLLLEAIG